jgi:hypothetical protein
MLERDPYFPRLSEPAQETEFSKLFWFFCIGLRCIIMIHMEFEMHHHHSYG